LGSTRVLRADETEGIEDDVRCDASAAVHRESRLARLEILDCGERKQSVRSRRNETCTQHYVCCRGAYTTGDQISRRPCGHPVILSFVDSGNEDLQWLAVHDSVLCLVH